MNTGLIHHRIQAELFIFLVAYDDTVRPRICEMSLVVDDEATPIGLVPRKRLE